MITLAIDTSSERSTLAIAMDKEIIVSVEHHSQKLQTGFFRLIERTLMSNDITALDITRVITGIGPGSFTGVRIGVSFAKTFSQFTNAELIPIRSYYLGVSDFEPGVYYLPLIPSTRSECYSALFRIGHEKSIETIHEVDDGIPERILNWLGKIPEGSHVKIYGEGIQMLEDLTLPGIVHTDLNDAADSMPKAERAFHFLSEFPEYFKPINPLELSPLYVRPSPAEIVLLRKQGEAAD